MSVITKHPQKEGIDALIKSNQYSYRELETELKTRFGLAISFKSIQAYHTKELGGVVDISTDGGGAGGNDPTPLPLDMAKVEELVLELTKKYGDSPIKKSTAKMYAIQSQITENALLSHSQGLCRYPSEYVKNLQILSNLLTKK